MTAQQTPVKLAQAGKRMLRIALIGAPNAGKSTLMNRLVMHDISCVSNKVHTTRKNVMGVYTQENTQLEFLDSPGTVTRDHVMRHHLEDSLLVSPKEASKQCDLLAAVVDVSNPREAHKINRGVLRLLHDHDDKKSLLIMNKIDKIKEKRRLLDIAALLTEGHLDGKPQSVIPDIKTTNTTRDLKPRTSFVIELDKHETYKTNVTQVGYRNFQNVFSVSALEDDGVDELREALLEMAIPAEGWAHGQDYLTNQQTKELVHAIIRGQVMDNTDHEIPYVVKYKYLSFEYDELGSLHVNLEIRAPKKYMIGKLLGQHGNVIFKIINESREKISHLLACDVKLNIAVLSQ